MKAEWKERMKAAADQIDTGFAAMSDLLQDVRDEFDELSEKAQEGKKGEALRELADKIESANDDVERGKDALFAIIDE